MRYENGRYLDGWYNRLRDAYLATMADLGVARRPVAGRTSWRRWTATSSRDPELAIVVSAIKATVKGGIGKLRERPRGEGWQPGRAVAGPVPPDVAAGHPRRRHLPHPDQPAPQDRQARGVHRPVPGRDPAPTASSTRPTARPRWTSCPTGTASRCRAASGSASTRAWSSTRAPRACCGARRSASGSTRRSSTSPGTSRTAPSPTRTTGSRTGDDEHVRGRPGRRRCSGRSPARLPKSAGAQMRYLVKQLKGTKAVAQMLRISQRTVERYVKDQIKKPRPDLAARLEREVKKRWQPQIRAKAQAEGGDHRRHRHRHPRPPRLHRADRVDGPGPHPAPDRRPAAAATPPASSTPRSRAPPTSSSRRSPPKRSRRCTSRTAAAAPEAWKRSASPTSSTSSSTCRRALNTSRARTTLSGDRGALTSVALRQGAGGPQSSARPRRTRCGRAATA